MNKFTSKIAAMDGTEANHQSQSHLALGHSVNLSSPISLTFPLIKETKEKMVSSAPLSHKMDFTPLEVTGDLHTPDIKLYGEFNFTSDDLKRVTDDRDKYSIDLNSSEVERSRDDLPLPTSPNFYEESFKVEKSAGQYEQRCTNYTSNSDQRCTNSSYEREQFSKEEVDLFPAQASTSDALFDFADLNIENPMDRFGFCFNDEACVGNGLENINQQIDLMDENILAQAINQSEVVDEMMDLNVDDFVRNILSNNDNFNFNHDLPTINSQCIDEDVQSNLFNGNGQHFSTVGSCGDVSSGQFSDFGGEIDLTCANILERAVGEADILNEEYEQFSRERLIDSFINTNSRDSFPSTSERCERQRGNFQQREIKLAQQPEQPPTIKCQRQIFNSNNNSWQPQQQNCLPEGAQPVKIVINSGSSPIIISHPRVEDDFKLERVVGHRTIGNLTVRRVAKKEIESNVNNCGSISTSQSTNAALRRKRKPSSKLSNSISSVAKGFGGMNLVAEDFSEINLDENDEDEDESKLSREDYADLSPADKYYRMREQNNKASKKCREKKKLEVGKSMIELNLLEEENGRLNREYKDMLRQVRHAKQLLLYR